MLPRERLQTASNTLVSWGCCLPVVPNVWCLRCAVTQDKKMCTWASKQGVRPHLVCDLPVALVVPVPRVGAASTDDHLGAEVKGLLFQLVIVDVASLQAREGQCSTHHIFFSICVDTENLMDGIPASNRESRPPALTAQFGLRAGTEAGEHPTSAFVHQSCA